MTWMHRPLARAADWVGMGGSLLCLLHCLALPLLVSVFAVGVGGHWVWLDYLFSGIAAAAVWQTTRRTRDPWVRGLLALGLLLFVAGLLAHDTLARRGLFELHLLGSLLLVLGHLRNLRRAASSSDASNTAACRIAPSPRG